MGIIVSRINKPRKRSFLQSCNVVYRAETSLECAMHEKQTTLSGKDRLYKTRTIKFCGIGNLGKITLHNPQRKINKIKSRWSTVRE